jgi:hypothetical protein
MMNFRKAESLGRVVARRMGIPSRGSVMFFPSYTFHFLSSVDDPLLESGAEIVPIVEYLGYIVFL